MPSQSRSVKRFRPPRPPACRTPEPVPSSVRAGTRPAYPRVRERDAEPDTWCEPRRREAYDAIRAAAAALFFHVTEGTRFHYLRPFPEDVRRDVETVCRRREELTDRMHQRHAREGGQH